MALVAAVKAHSRTRRGLANRRLSKSATFRRALDTCGITANMAQVMGECAEAGDALVSGTRVGDYRIRGLLGEGAMGQVYLAQDIKLGRRVALKLIKRSVMQGDGVERFLEEARATAAFNHPHIVTIHAVGEHEGRPYLALEYIDGESLRARLAAGPLPVVEALRYCRAVAEAIAEAHRRGLVHADLKPDNIVIPRDGRVRVVDFGLAKLAGTSPNNGSGTPAYMAPERWYGAPPSGAIDVWAFGVILHELVTGRRPIPDAALMHFAFAKTKPDLSGLPVEPWAAIVQDCLALDPAARPTAEALVARLTPLTERRVTGISRARTPFPGLAAFSRDHASEYVGRQAKLDLIVEQLRARPLIPLVGPAGIGKSSFLRAALVPRLEEMGGWIAIAVRPGATPFDSLAAALALPDRPATTARTLRAPGGMARALGDVARHHGARVLLCLDPFEEIFTLAASKAEAIAFCDCVGRAAAEDAPWRIVLAVRDDRLDRLATAPAIRPHLGAMLRLGPLSSVDLRAAIARPLVNAGYRPDAPELVDRIMADVEGQPGCLPLLQLTCQSLWERRDAASRRVLTAEYVAMGGAAGALAGQARRLMAELTPDEVQVVRALLLALHDAGGSVRPRRRRELIELVPARSRDAAGRLVDRLLERRILIAVQPAATLQIAHDALHLAWPQLARWLDETHDERLALARLEDAALTWQRHGRRDADTWRGDALAELAGTVDKLNLTVPPVSRAFLDASLRNARRSRRRWRWLALALSLVMVALSILSLTLTRHDQERLRALDLQKSTGDAAPVVRTSLR